MRSVTLPGAFNKSRRGALADSEKLLKQPTVGAKGMCAIGGIYSRPGTCHDMEAILGRMVEVQKHRGPDADGIWISADRTLGVCHNRLSILDLSSAGNQPMHSADHLYTVVFNGEIYNYRELRSELSALGAHFRSNSDTEVILEGYRFWGEDVLERLRGMFAFGLYDHRERSLFCARDPVGKKPFVYAELNEGFVFGSEIPAVLKAPGVDKTPDRNAIAAMLIHNMRHVPDPSTAFKGVRRLRPGHGMRVTEGRVKRVWRYWSPSPAIEPSLSQLRETLEDAVSIRAVADVPVGALLSGGIDSTAIVNLMQKKMGEPLRTYAFGANSEDEDLRRARFVAEKLGTHHQEFYFSGERQLGVFKKMLGIYGEPIMLLPLIHTYEMATAIREDGVKVVLNGNGADEIFFGYTGHLRTAAITKSLSYLNWARGLLSRTEWGGLSDIMKLPGFRKASFYRRNSKQYWSLVLQDHVIPSLRDVIGSEMEYWGQVLPCEDFIDESNYLALLIENSHSVTTASDLPAMMASVEMRSPFLDSQILNVAMGIPYTDKVRGPSDGSQLKFILRKAVSDLVETDILNAPKRGFGMGIQEKDVLLGPWRQEADRLLCDFPELGMFDKKKICDVWTNAKLRQIGDWCLLGKLMAIALWAEQIA